MVKNAIPKGGRPRVWGAGERIRIDCLKSQKNGLLLIAKACSHDPGLLEKLMFIVDGGKSEISRSDDRDGG